MISVSTVTSCLSSANSQLMLLALRLLALVAALIPAPPALSAAPPQVGQEAPDFRLDSLAGTSVRFADVAKRGPTILLVLRGYPGYQCPICNRQVRDFLTKAKLFAEAGAQVVMVYPGPADRLSERAAEFTAEKSFPGNFHFLLDPGYSFTNLYSLRWNEPKETAYPSTFVVGPDRKVKFAKISTAHGGRTTPEEVLAVLGVH